MTGAGVPVLLEAMLQLAPAPQVSGLHNGGAGMLAVDTILLVVRDPDALQPVIVL